MLSLQVSLNPAYQVKEVDFTLKKVELGDSALAYSHNHILTALLNQSQIQKHDSWQLIV